MDPGDARSDLRVDLGVVRIEAEPTRVRARNPTEPPLDSWGHGTPSRRRPGAVTLGGRKGTTSVGRAFPEAPASETRSVKLVDVRTSMCDRFGRRLEDVSLVGQMVIDPHRLEYVAVIGPNP